MSGRRGQGGRLAALFLELGLELEGETSVSGPWVDQVVGLDNVHSDDPANTLGLRRVMFAVDDLLCYLRGPGGMVVALAEELGS